METSIIDINFSNENHKTYIIKLSKRNNYYVDDLEYHIMKLVKIKNDYFEDNNPFYEDNKNYKGYFIIQN